MQAMATRTRRVALGLCVMATLVAAHAPLAHAQGTTSQAGASSTVAILFTAAVLPPLSLIVTFSGNEPSSA